MEQNNRCADTNQPQTTQTHSPNQNKSHVLTYILILFIAAFLMMALSFLSHQHTNEQVLGQLKTNVSSLGRLQSALEENMQLQEQLDAQKIQLEELQKGLSASQESQSKLSEQLTELEKETARNLVKANATNLNAKLARVSFVETVEEVLEVLS